MDDNTNTLRTMSIGEILDNTFKVYGRNFLSILAFSTVIGGIFSVIIGLVTHQMMPTSMTSNSWTNFLENPNMVPEVGPDALADMLPQLFAFQGVMILLSIVNGVFIKPFIQGGIINLTYNDIKGQKLNIRQGLIAALKKFWKLVLTSLSLIPYYIGVAIVLIILTVLFVIPLVLSGVAMSNDPTGGRVAGFVFMLFITIVLMMVIAILSNIFVTFTYHGTAIEDICGFSAIGRSFKLVSKKFWRVLGISLLVYLIVGIIGIVLIFISGITSIVSPNPLLGDFAIGFVMTAFITPIMYIATTLLFIDIKARVEGIQEQRLV